MSFPKTLPIIATALLGSHLFVNTAAAQLGMAVLPQNDFTWTWGEESLARGSFRNLSMIGSDGGFRCELNATMRSTSRLGRQELNRIENNIRDNLYFVRSAANMMYSLDVQRELGYATLACEKPQVDLDADEEKRAAREARARERAARERERRRARREEANN